MPERRATVETETGNAKNGELHCQHIALLAARIVTGRLVNSGYFAIREGSSVEARRLVRVFVEPEADRVFWFHIRVLRGLDPGELRGLASVGISAHQLIGWSAAADGSNCSPRILPF